MLEVSVNRVQACKITVCKLASIFGSVFQPAGVNMFCIQIPYSAYLPELAGSMDLVLSIVLSIDLAGGVEELPDISNF
jgi:hypothetical protein